MANEMLIFLILNLNFLCIKCCREFHESGNTKRYLGRTQSESKDVNSNAKRTAILSVGLCQCHASSGSFMEERGMKSA